MGGSNMFVWGEGAWRELDLSSGTVSGWRRRARFVFVRRGRLRVARRGAVLRALRALAAGRAGPAADGPRLSYRSKREPRPPARAHRPACPTAPAPAPAPAALHCAHHHCCAHYNGCNNNITSPAKTECPAPPPCQLRAHAITISTPHPHQQQQQPAARPQPPPARPSNVANVNALLSKRKPAPRSKRAPSYTSGEREAGPTPGGASGTAPGPARDARVWETRGRDAHGAVCKELIVPESDVLALRGFVSRTRADALERFDADDEYKRALFYAINPLVELERCAELERRLRERDASALPQFAARLGLEPRAPAASASAPAGSASAPSSSASAADRKRRRRAATLCLQRISSPDTDKENKQDKRSPLSGRKRILRGKPAPPPAPAAPPPAPPPAPAAREPPRPARRLPTLSPAPPPPTHGAHVISKRALAAGCKEYSNLEDHAIVAWVSAGSRASLVNGNRLWRELQTRYPSLTGCNRSWHSLRNRYLRYILPGLGALRLPPAHESRLRAAAASGVTKRKMKGLPAPPQRRNSIFKEAALVGASSRRRAGRSRSRSRSASSSDDDAPLKPAASNGRGITNGGVTSARRSLRTLARERDNNRSPAPSRLPRYSELTRQFAARHTSAESSPAPARSAPAPGPAPAGGARSRRLFNPNANVL